jgi:alkanesulfonate monooxygenase
MSAQVFWTLPPSGDGRSASRARFSRGDFQGISRPTHAPGLTDDRGRHFTYYDQLFQVARAAESSGFKGVLIPWEPAGEDPWIVAAALVRQTRGLVFLPELEPGFATPVYLAKMSVSFQRLSGNRLAWQFELERDPQVRSAHGDPLQGDDYFQRVDEYLEAARGVLLTRPYDFRGRFYDVEKGGFDAPLAGTPLPPIFTSGSSDAALALAGRRADFHLVRGASLDGIKSAIARLEAAASKHGRSVKPARRRQVVARHTDEEARAAAREAGAEAALIGSYDDVAQRLESYLELGVERLILSGYPHLEEAYRLGEHVLPKLSARRAMAREPAAPHVTTATPQLGSN